MTKPKAKQQKPKSKAVRAWAVKPMCVNALICYLTKKEAKANHWKDSEITCVEIRKV